MYTVNHSLGMRDAVSAGPTSPEHGKGLRFHDPVEFELLKSAVLSIADEMAVTIFRASYSGVLKSNMDFSTAIFDASGNLIAQGLTVPALIGGMPTAISEVIRIFGNDIKAGDVYILNDPYSGGMHLPDIFIFEPIFFEGELVGHAGSVCHHGDVGGRVPGSNAADSTEIYQEGLRLPPLKLYEAGKANDAIFALLSSNTRLPRKLFGDLRSQLAASYTCKTAMVDLIHRYGIDTIKRHFVEVVDYAEYMTREAIRRLSDGVYRFADFIDDDGIDVGRPIPLKVTVEKRGDSIIVDWTGSSEQVKGAINSTFSFTTSATHCALRSIFPENIPGNAGFYKPIEIIAPPGTIANCSLPAACAARGLTGSRMVDCLYGALAQMLPDAVFACGDGGTPCVTIGGYSREREPFIFVDFTCCSWGGRPYADGIDGNASMFGNMASQSIELIEAEQPIQILRYEFIQDGMGAGMYRGGAPSRRDYKLLADEAVLQMRSDRNRTVPYGLFGGKPGKPSRNVFNPGAANDDLPGKFLHTMRAGDVFRHELAGSGGWGDPLRRDPERVLADVVNEFVSVEAAREDYGVVIATSPLRVDVDATKRLRQEMLRARDWAEAPFVSSSIHIAEHGAP